MNAKLQNMLEIIEAQLEAKNEADSKLGYKDYQSNK